jgi:hypothetical protein
VTTNVARTLHDGMSMTVIRHFVILTLLFGGVLVAASPTRRARLARKLEESRRFVSRRLVDRDARERARWDDDGGAIAGAVDAAIQ